MDTEHALLIYPSETVSWYEYLLLEPVSHHDPGMTDRSNFSMYRRQLERVNIEIAGRLMTSEETHRICEAFPVPADVAPFFEDEPFARFVAAAIVKLFIEAYGGLEGEGIFTGVERYRRLESRLAQTAARVRNLKEFWSVLMKEMRVGSPDASEIRSFMILLSTPRSFAEETLYHFAKYSQLIVMLARSWAETAKGQNPEYAKKAGIALADETDVVLEYEPPTLIRTDAISVPVPVHSANDIRHDLREAGMAHLLYHLGMKFDDTLPKHIKALLENAGAMSEKEPHNAYQQTQRIRERFPLLGLLGGSMPGFLLGEGNLQSVGAYYYGKENNNALAEIGIESSDSIWDLLDQWTLTRHATRSDESPMPYSFETIQKGAKLYVRFQFHPFITDLEIGAFAAAIKTFQESNGTIGGQAARGFGRVEVSPVREIEGLESYQLAYETHLYKNATFLKQLLLDGGLGESISLPSGAEPEPSDTDV